MFSNLTDKIKLIDIFYRTIKFETRESENYKTIFGGLLTIITGITMIVIGFLFGREIYQRKNPLVLNSDILLEYSRINMNEFPLFFTFNLAGGKNIPDPGIDKVFDFETQALSFLSNGTTYNKFYKGYSKCDLDKFVKNKNIIKDAYEGVLKNKREPICFHNDIVKSNSNENNNMYSDGLFFKNDYALNNSTFVNFKIKLCKEDKSINKTCHPDLETLTDQIYIKIYTVDSFLDPQNYEKPITYFQKTLGEQINNSINKRLFLRVVNNELENDNSWIFEEKNIIKFHHIHSIKQETNKVFKSEVFSLTLESPIIINRTTRSYMKVQDLFAKIGGMFSALRIMFLILSYHYTRYNFLLYSYNLKKRVEFNFKNDINASINSPCIKKNNAFNFDNINININNNNNNAAHKLNEFKINPNNLNDSNNKSNNFNSRNNDLSQDLALSKFKNNITKVLNDNKANKDFDLNLKLNKAAVYRPNLEDISSTIKGKFENNHLVNEKNNLQLFNNKSIIPPNNNNHNLKNISYSNYYYSYIKYILYKILCLEYKIKEINKVLKTAKSSLILKTYMYNSMIIQK